MTLDDLLTHISAVQVALEKMFSSASTANTAECTRSLQLALWFIQLLLTSLSVANAEPADRAKLKELALVAVEQLHVFAQAACKISAKKPSASAMHPFSEVFRNTLATWTAVAKQLEKLKGVTWVSSRDPFALTAAELRSTATAVQSVVIMLASFEVVGDGLASPRRQLGPSVSSQNSTLQVTQQLSNAVLKLVDAVVLVHGETEEDEDPRLPEWRNGLLTCARALSLHMRNLLDTYNGFLRGAHVGRLMSSSSHVLNAGVALLLACRAKSYVEEMGMRSAVTAAAAMLQTHGVLLNVLQTSATFTAPDEDGDAASDAAVGADDLELTKRTLKRLRDAARGGSVSSLSSRARFQ